MKCYSDPKLIWPVLFKCFIDDVFGVTEGLLEDDLLDNYNWGNALDYMDLFIYKGNDFYEDGKLSVSIHQKETNKFMYIPYRSFHQNTQSKTTFGEN